MNPFLLFRRSALVLCGCSLLWMQGSAPLAAAPAATAPTRGGALSATASPETGRQAESAALAAKVQARYQQVSSLAAVYQRKSIFVAAGNDSERSVEGEGCLLWARPTSLRLDQQEPRKELIVIQQNSVWWVRPQRGRADIYPLDRFTSGLRSLMDALGGLARVDESFTVEPAPEEDRTPAVAGQSILVLKPKEKHTDLKRLVLWFNPEDMILQGFRIVSLIGDVTEYRLQQVQVNPSLAADSFTYQAPADYKLTDHRSQAPSGDPR
ncbi:outer membrane lipoprotein carrier protein [Desulfarculales bacterium]